MKHSTPTSKIPLAKNSLIPLEITDVSGLGSGFGKTEDGTGKAVFVPGTVPGDRILCRIIKVNGNYLVGKIEEILSPSPDRVDPDCDVFSRCGGCSLRQMTYEAEKALKRDFVKAELRKAGLDTAVLPVLSTGHRSGYRNKVQYPVAPDGQIGYFAPHSHRVVPCDGCRLHHPSMDETLRCLRRYIQESGISVYDEQSGKGILRHLFLRCNRDGSQQMVCLVVNLQKGGALPEQALLLRLLSDLPAVTSVFLSHNTNRTNVILGKESTLLWGVPYLTDRLLGLEFRIALPSFYQVNHDGCELLYREVRKFAALQEGDRLTDLFCGIGTIGLTVAAGVKGVHLTGVEIVPEAVENAKENAVRNGMTDAEFFCGDADHPALAKSDVILVDPPRKGLTTALIDRLCALSPRRIVYVSCAPDTLARDLHRFQENGWIFDAVQPVDMFPGTFHVESVVCLTRK